MATRTSLWAMMLSSEFTQKAEDCAHQTDKSFESLALYEELIVIATHELCQNANEQKLG